MKLIHLEIIPDANPLGETAIAIIDHDPDVFKACYVRVARLRDGSLHITEHPANITQQALDDTFKHALVIIDMVYDITSGF